jgi:fumarylacetoacetase
VSGPAKDQRGAFIELTWGGTEPVIVGDEKRTFLEDGDEIVITASAPGPDGTRIGFGEVAGRITAAVSGFSDDLASSAAEIDTRAVNAT